MEIDSVFHRWQNYVSQRIIENLNDPEWHKAYEENRKKFPENFKKIKMTFKNGQIREGYFDGDYYWTTDSKYWMENRIVDKIHINNWEYVD